jgi:serine/threonine protein kinase
MLLEIDILRELDHPNVIKLYCVYESQKYIHLLMPYLEGGELFDRIRRKGLYNEKDASVVMHKFVDALAYMHSKSVVHRDLKPENLILASKEDCTDLRIADFGLATYMDAAWSPLFQRCGSPGYVAPELLADKGYDT